jgi:hypothetical protein
MAIVERGEAFYVKLHRGRGRYEHVGTFRWSEDGGKRAAQERQHTARLPRQLKLPLREAGEQQVQGESA